MLKMKIFLSSSSSPCRWWKFALRSCSNCSASASTCPAFWSSAEQLVAIPPRNTLRKLFPWVEQLSFLLFHSLSARWWWQTFSLHKLPTIINHDFFSPFLFLHVQQEERSFCSLGSSMRETLKISTIFFSNKDDKKFHKSFNFNWFSLFSPLRSLLDSASNWASQNVSSHIALHGSRCGRGEKRKLNFYWLFLIVILWNEFFMVSVHFAFLFILRGVCVCLTERWNCYELHRLLSFVCFLPFFRVISIPENIIFFLFLPTLVFIRWKSTGHILRPFYFGSVRSILTVRSFTVSELPLIWNIWNWVIQVFSQFILFLVITRQHSTHAAGPVSH